MSMDKYSSLRQEYPVFVFSGYTVAENDRRIKITYDFEIEGLSEFSPTWTFLKKGPAYGRCMTGDRAFEKLVIGLGMTELVSYWKITCSPTVRIEAAELDETQKSWWKDLYFNGLGEFFYTNGITADPETFMNIEAAKPSLKDETLKMPDRELTGCLIPVGGGKDSAVSIELMKKTGQKCMCYIINPRGASIHTAEVGGFDTDADVISVKRTLDRNMLRLNREGFLNGHTPYSAVVAFSSVLTAYMYGLKYVVLSNEASANESTVPGSTVNHQYSKSFKFEKDFHEYEQNYILSGVDYFSLLRPLSEFQIAKFFAGCKEYHSVFRSCNAGSKEDRWCGHCSKCLFVFLILSPFMPHEDIVSIFGTDMLTDADMLPVMDQLTGTAEVKPFECVGSRDEINTAICLTIDRMENDGKELPLLLDEYKKSSLYARYDAMGDMFSEKFNGEHLVPDIFVSVVRENCCKK